MELQEKPCEEALGDEKEMREDAAKTVKKENSAPEEAGRPTSTEVSEKECGTASVYTRLKVKALRILKRCEYSGCPSNIKEIVNTMTVGDEQIQGHTQTSRYR
ncbi:Hypothetical predicted protein [Octopus vulgaris]|uniref:Uncharacterized protein n=1 Tax=Octopus vulgaris TaxID=6645 RepID=A0AA36ARF9_OCTVU|nr:Hypothetical predicted protein [Octopus vulgaris]